MPAPTPAPTAPLPPCRLVVVLPVGPTCPMDYTLDTLASIRHYTEPSTPIVIVDDSGKGKGCELLKTHADLHVVTTRQPHGKDGGLYLTLSMGYRYALEHFDFEVLLRMDTDALVIGPRPEVDAARYFADHPDVGILGTYKTDCGGKASDFAWSAKQFRRETSWRYLARQPYRLSLFLLLRRALRRAAAHGYEIGEHILGGAYFMSRSCVARLAEHRLLGRRALRRSIAQEDHLFALLSCAAGMRLADFATDPWPMAVRWKGLPLSPAELAARDKKVIHSTRFYRQSPDQPVMRERDIRAYFQQKRETQAHE